MNFKIIFSSILCVYVCVYQIQMDLNFVHIDLAILTILSKDNKINLLK